MDWKLVLIIILAVIAWLIILRAVTICLTRNMADTAPGWRVRCTSCGHTKPAGEAGVVRLGAAGKKYTLGRCSSCNSFRFIAIERDPDYQKAGQQRTS